MGLKHTKLYTKLTNENMQLKQVDEKLVKEILYSPKRKKDFARIVRDDGRMIVWFRHEALFEQVQMDMENNEKESWFLINERTFSFSDEMENYNIIVAEFKSEWLLDHMERQWADEMTNAYFGVKEDTGRYSVYDVYSPSELGINVKY